jgi:succinyl-CoA synthetase beta subunit
MARLYEYQGKALLQQFKVAVPRGRVARSPEEARAIAEEIGKPVMVKAQAWVTGRAQMGGIKRATTPDEAAEAARGMLGLKVKGFTVEQVLVEEQLDIASEYYAGVIIDDQAQAPLVMFSSVGGTGIEEIAAAHPDKVARTHVDIETGLQEYQARNLVRRTGIGGKLQSDLAALLVSLYDLARTTEARAAEINPLVQTTDGKLYAADCRVTVDDYAVFRHPDLGIEIAREYDRPPTPLEKIAYAVEAKDYRGTFYFIQMASDFKKGEGYIGFHGAGGGGSMMSMDALLRHGYKLATFVDTSGNPPASKVYRAARIVLATGPLTATSAPAPVSPARSSSTPRAAGQGLPGGASGCPGGHPPGRQRRGQGGGDPGAAQRAHPGAGGRVQEGRLARVLRQRLRADQVGRAAGCAPAVRPVLRHSGPTRSRRSPAARLPMTTPSVPPVRAKSA